MNTLSSLFDFTGKNMGVLEITRNNVSSLPVTISDSRILKRHVCVKAELSNPSAQINDWTVTSANGSVTISGSGAINGTTNVKLYLALKTNGTNTGVSIIEHKTNLAVTRLASGSDLNTLIGNENSGFYYIETGVANVPDNLTYGGLLVIAYNNTTFQIATNQGGIWWRAYTFSPFSWSDWRSTKGPTFQDKVYGDTYTIPSAGYLELDDGTDFSGKHILSILIFHWSENSGAFSVARGGGNRIYLIGDPGTTVRNVQLRILYQY